MKNHKKFKHSNIKLLILDVDGVLTDGKIYISDDGVETKSFNVQDGLGLQLLLNTGINVAIISGRKSNAAKIRLRELGIKYAYFGAIDKNRIFEQLKKKLVLKNENIAYMGDDLSDLAIMQKVGYSIAVANAVQKIRNIADYVTKARGGDGAVREACEILI